MLRSIPCLGSVRARKMLTNMRTPFRLRTKRTLWPYAGLEVTKHTSANQEFETGNLQKSKKARR